MELAALATAAVPGLSPTGVAAAVDDARDFTSAVVMDSEGSRWRIRSPQHQEAAMRLETELQVLRGFTASVRAELPFRVPSVAGAVRRGEMRTFVYNHLPGHSMDLQALSAQSPELTEDIGRTIAAVHDLDEAVVDNADLPRYSAERFRQRRLNELDQAATTGQIPPSLLRRWEHALEEKALWNFEPVVTHGDLHEDNLMVEGHRVVAVTGWTDLHIGDPADDFAWLTAASEQAFTDQVLEAYQQHRDGEADQHLMRRAALAAEFALAQWLVRGHASGNQEMVDEALAMLQQLKNDIEAYGGQPIALTPMEGETPSQSDTGTVPVARAGAAASVADTGEWADTGEGDLEPAVITDASVSEETAGETVSDEEETGQLPAVPADVAGTGSAPAAPSAAASTASPAPAESPDSQRQGQAEQSSPRFVEEDETPTGALPPVADQSEAPTGTLPRIEEDSEAPTGTIPPVSDPVSDTASPDTGSLPLRPDPDYVRRRRTKNYFPRSASSAASAGSAGSANSAASADSANSAASAGSATSPVTSTIERIDPQQDSRREPSGQEKTETTPAGEITPESAQERTTAGDAGPEQAGTETNEPKSSGSIYSAYPGLRPPGA